MADYNIPDLVELTAPNVAATDWLEIYDDDAGENKKVLVSSLIGTKGALTNSRVVYRSSGAYATNDNFQFDGNYVGIGGASATGFRVRIYGEDAGSTNFALRILNNSSVDLWSFRNDGVITSLGNQFIQTTYNATTPNIRVGFNNTYTGNQYGVSVGHNNTITAAGSGPYQLLGSSNSINNSAGGGGAMVLGASNAITTAGGFTMAVGSGIIGSSTTGGRGLFFGSNYTFSVGGGSLFVWDTQTLSATNASGLFFRSFNSNLPTVYNNLSIGVTPSGVAGNGVNTFVVKSGTAPSIANVTDTAVMYVADIVAGNAAPHFRTENNAIIRLYQNTTAITAATYAAVGGTTIQTNDTFDGYTVGQAIAALRANGLLQ